MTSKSGKLTNKAGEYEVRFERTLPHSAEAVWDAITNPEKLKLWFTDIDMDFKPGGRMMIHFHDAARTKSPGKINVIEPGKVFEFDWEGEIVRWELYPEGEKSCKLVLSHRKITPAYVVSASAGFHSLFDRLELMLDGNKRTYKFGSVQDDPADQALRKKYSEDFLKAFPELKRFEPIVVEKTYRATVDRVWKAITDKDQMKQWYFTLEDFRAEPGFEFQFYGQGHKGEQYLHLCKVIEAIPEKKLSYTWKYDGYEGESTVTFELFPEGENTRLVLTHRGLGSFPADNPDFARESFSAGWNELVGSLLEKYLEREKV